MTRENTKLKDLIALLNKAVQPMAKLKFKAGAFHEEVGKLINDILSPFEMEYRVWNIEDSDRSKHRANDYLKLELERVVDKRAHYATAWKVVEISFVPVADISQVSDDITVADYLKLLKLEDVIEKTKYTEASITEHENKLGEAREELQEQRIEIDALRSELKNAYSQTVSLYKK